MKITADASALAKALSIVGRAAARNPTRPILSSVLFRAEGGALTLSATDGTLSITLACRVKVDEEGTAALPARVLTEIVKSLPAGEITISAEGSHTALTAGQSSYTLRAYDASDFPAIRRFSEAAACGRSGARPDDGSTTEDASEGSGDGSAGALQNAARSFSLPAKEFAGAVSKVAQTASRDDTKPVIRGVLCAFEREGMKLVATDSYRLSIHESNGQSRGPSEPVSAVVPAYALTEASRVALLAENVEVCLAEGKAVFRAASVEVSSALVAGSYPDYGKLIPEGFARELCVEASALRETLKRVNLFASRTSPPQPVKLAFAREEEALTGGSVTVSVQSKETGAATETLAADVAEGQEFTFCANGEYLADGVATLTGEEGTGKVRIKANEPEKPVLMVPDGGGSRDGSGNEAASGYTYLLMPMRDPNPGDQAEGS